MVGQSHVHREVIDRCMSMSSVSSTESPSASAFFAMAAKSRDMLIRCSRLTLKASAIAKAPIAAVTAVMVAALASYGLLFIVFAFKFVCCVLALLRRAGGCPFLPAAIQICLAVVVVVSSLITVRGKAHGVGQVEAAGSFFL